MRGRRQMVIKDENKSLKQHQPSSLHLQYNPSLCCQVIFTTTVSKKCMISHDHFNSVDFSEDTQKINEHVGLNE